MRSTASGWQTYVLLAAGVFAGGAQAAAQEPPPPPPVPVSEVPPFVPVTSGTQDPPPAVPPAQNPPGSAELVMKPEPPRAIDPERRREQVIAMEGLLTSAVKSGATAAAKQMMAFEPNLMFTTAPARAKGFYLDDYGVFFHVEIPGVAPNVAWLFDNLNRNPAAPDRDPRPERTVGSSRAAQTFNPDAAYVLAVQQKLIDAMLDYRIDLRQEEWLTVAARDGEAPLYPGQIVENPIMILRIRASDLADFYAGRISREEARARVEVREF